MNHYSATKFVSSEATTILRYKIIWFSWVFLFITLTSFSQTKRYLYYFDKDFKLVERAKSAFNGIGLYEDGLIALRVYNYLNNNLVFIEHFTDSSLSISNGFFGSYYTNGSQEWEGNYLMGKEDGLWRRRDSLGHMIDSTIYNNGEKMIEVHVGYQQNGHLDSFIVNDKKADKLQKIYYDSSGKVKSEVSFTGQKGFEKVYKNGTIERSDSVFSRDEIEASFPGGAAAWTRYVMNYIERNQDAFTRADYGTCIVKFIVDIDGKISNVEPTTMKETKLAEVMVNAVRNGPRWKPASQYGRPVKAYRLQPVSLSDPR